MSPAAKQTFLQLFGTPGRKRAMKYFLGDSCDSSLQSRQYVLQSDPAKLIKIVGGPKSSNFFCKTSSWRIRSRVTMDIGCKALRNFWLLERGIKHYHCQFITPPLKLLMFCGMGYTLRKVRHIIKLAMIP